MRSKKEFEENQNIGTAPPTTGNSQRSAPISRYAGERPHPQQFKTLGPKGTCYNAVKIAFLIGRKTLTDHPHSLQYADRSQTARAYLNPWKF